jgi:pSer/pThr/pTyr-binding forkhead associated (FHA) protein
MSNKQTAIISSDNPLLRRAINQQTSSQEMISTSTLRISQEVLLLIRGMVERMEMSEGGIYKLGRFEFSSPNVRTVDLTPYGAADRGVSREHAQLHLEGEKLYITDLGSTNGTYVRATRLNPNEATLLSKGEEILLGRLSIQVVFR